MPILDYILRASLATAWQLAIFLGPALLLAGILHFLSRYVRNRAARLFGADFYVYFTAPGVVIHELGHVVFCLLFGHRIVRVRLFKPDANGTLGQVDHAYNPRNAYQAAGNFFIGTGPIWLGTLAIYLLSSVLMGSSVSQDSLVGSPAESGRRMASTSGEVSQQLDSIWRTTIEMIQRISDSQSLQNWTGWLVVYLIFCVGSHITLSTPDITGAWRGFLWLVGLLLVFNLITTWANVAWDEQLARVTIRSGASLYAAGAFVVLINLSLALLVRVLGTLTGR